MTIWAISDLHLSHAHPDAMAKHGKRWDDHIARLESQWRASVATNDLVLIPGDISLAGNHRDVQPDLAWLGRMPGTKVLAPGNHDTWWNNLSGVRAMLRRTTYALDGDAIALNGIIVCGARSAEFRSDSAPNPNATRALQALQTALDAARALRQADEPIYVLWHHPPFDERGRPTPVVQALEQGGATACVYGHLHQLGQWSTAVHGERDGVRYACVAADALGFRPLRVK